MISRTRLIILSIVVMMHLACKSTTKRAADSIEIETEDQTVSGSGLCASGKPASYKETVRILLKAFNLATCEELAKEAEGYTSLEVIGLGLVDLGPFAEFTNLRQISSIENPIKDASPLMKLENLKVIAIQMADITDLQWLKFGTQIEQLHLRNNQISSLEGIQNAKNLKNLVIGNNSIDSLAPLSGLPNLKHLEISSNNISDISALKNIPMLSDYTSFENFENDLSSLSDNKTLTSIGISSKKLDKSNHKTCPRGPGVNVALSRLCEDESVVVGKANAKPKDDL